MKYIFSQTIYTGFVLAVYFVVQMMRRREIKYKENKLFVAVCIFSAIWSFGFCGVILQTDPSKAYSWRAIGMIGTFGYLIAAQFLICYLAGVKKIYCYLTEGFSLLGILIYFFVIQKSQVIYELGPIGMTYSFRSTFWNNLYILYTVLVAINQFWVILYMIKRAKIQRFKELGKKLLVIEVIMLAGMVLDTVFPIFGQPAIPGSTIGQAVGLIVMYHTISFANHSRITIGNMSEFIYNSLTVPVLVYNAAGELQILNDNAFSFFGVYNMKMQKTSIDEFFSISKEEVFQFESNSKNLDTICTYNGKYCNLTINKILDDYGDEIGYIIIVTDLSERVRAMKRLEEATKEAEYANQAKSIFLANMSHEIRTPMNAIIGFSELLLKKSVDNDIRSHVEDIKWSSQNLLAIINDILDISKIESGKMELVPDNYYLANIINDVVLIITPQAEKKNLKFEVQVDDTIPQGLYGDKVRIRGILINLLNNAVKYTKEGSVKFEVFQISKRDNKLRLAFRVTDTGVGIKKENIKTLFDHFERLDQKLHYGIEGSGLGLSIAKSFVNLMGGEIKVSSKYGEGSVFTVEIEQKIIDETPIGKEYLKVRTADRTSRLEGITIQNVRVLVVDDNQINLKVAHGILSSYGLDVDLALSGKESIELCKKQNYQIVFMDQMMPEMDGAEAMQAIRRECPYYVKGGASKIIALTANAIKGTREVLMNQGFDEYLGKPLNMDRLESLLCELIPEENMVSKNTEFEANVPGNDKEVAYLKDHLSCVDVDMGISHSGGQVEDYLKVLEITYKYGRKQLQELKQLWEEKEYKLYTIKVHSLKSTSLNIGAKEVSAEAKRQEEAGLNGDYEYIQNNIEKLIGEYTQIMDKIEEVLIHYGMNPENMSEEDEEKPLMDERMVFPMLQNIEKHVDDFEFNEVFHILEEVKKYRIPKQYTQVLCQIEEYMDELAVEEIKTLIKKTLENE